MFDKSLENKLFQCVRTKTTVVTTITQQLHSSPSFLTAQAGGLHSDLACDCTDWRDNTREKCGD